MSEVMTLPNQPVIVERKCRIEEVFDQNFIELIGMAPRNPYVRALILKLTGKMPGQECETFEQIKEWVETSCEKKVRAPQNRATRGVGNDGISIRVEFSEDEYGQADYTVRRYDREEFRISADDLAEMVQASIDAGRGIDDLVEIIAGKIDDDAWDQCDPSMDDYGDYDYDEHEANDYGNRENSYSKSEIRDRVLAFLRERHPGMAEQL